MTALMWAAGWNQNCDVISTLLKAGADLKARDKTHGDTVLMFAAIMNPNPVVITTLLKAGADIEARESYYSWTALMLAAKQPERQGDQRTAECWRGHQGSGQRRQDCADVRRAV